MKDNKRLKRHCMVVHAYYPLGETRVEREAMALIDRGYEVDVLCLRDEGECQTEVVDGVRIDRLPVRRHRGCGLASQLLEYLAFFLLVVIKLFSLQGRRRYSSIQCHNLPDFLIFAAFWPKLRGARLIIDLHDLMPEFYAARFGGRMDSWPVRLVKLEERLSCRFADRIITVTELWRQTLIERGVPAEKITVVMNVPDATYYHRQAGSKPAAVNGEFEIIYHGTLTPRYGVDLIIQALAEIEHGSPEVRLTILGDGDHRQELLAMVADLGLEERVSFSDGFVPTPELPDLIRRANAGVVPNRDDIFTGALLPTKLLEYVALGLPIIAARTPAIATYFDDSTIEFFTPGSATDLAQHIRRLSCDPARRNELIQNTDAIYRHNSWREIARTYADLVDEVAMTGKMTLAI
ncbi:MAG TPA: glycosyltransferase family 4 protein [Anaerolineae bacterium]|nr:glycosyltransferase family 4 protein [Anaerolineae bacterium]